jgi:hypothetical protein
MFNFIMDMDRALHQFTVKDLERALVLIIITISIENISKNYVKDTLGLIVHRQKYRSNGSNKNNSSRYFLEQQSFQFPLGSFNML